MDKNMLNDEQLNEVSGGTKIPYVVVAGDTLTAIAQKNNVSLADLMRWNNTDYQLQRKTTEAASRNRTGWLLRCRLCFAVRIIPARRPRAHPGQRIRFPASGAVWEGGA